MTSFERKLTPLFERIFIKMRNTEIRFVIGPGKVLFSLFSPEMLQAEAVKGLRQSLSKKVPAVCSPFNRRSEGLLVNATSLSVCGSGVCASLLGWVERPVISEYLIRRN